MKSSQWKYEVVEIFGEKYRRVPAVRMGWCEGCVNNMDKHLVSATRRQFCDEVEVAHENSCRGAVFIPNTQEALDKKKKKKIIARLED